MIKQDNRPESDTFETRLNSLKRLLHEPTEQYSKKTIKNSDVSNEPEKSVFISVNGNNNIISTGEAQYVIQNKKKKRALFAAFVFCMLFF